MVQVQKSPDFAQEEVQPRHKPRLVGCLQTSGFCILAQTWSAWRCLLMQLAGLVFSLWPIELQPKHWQLHLHASFHSVLCWTSAFRLFLLRWLFAWMAAFPLQVQVVLPSLCFASDQQLLQIGLRSAAHAWASLRLAAETLSSVLPFTLKLVCGLAGGWLGWLRKRVQRWHLLSASIATKTSRFSDLIFVKHRGKILIKEFCSLWLSYSLCPSGLNKVIFPFVCFSDKQCLDRHWDLPV